MDNNFPNIENIGDIGEIQGYVEEDDITRIDTQLKEQGKKGIVFDPSGGLENGVAPINLPNVNEILDKIVEILEYMGKDEIIKLKQEDDGEYSKHMEEKFPAFSFRYFSLFQKVISGDNLTHLFSMLGAIERIKKGELTAEEAEKNLGEELAEEYIYPNVPGSKPNGQREINNSKQKRSKRKKKKGGKKKKKRRKKEKQRKIFQSTAKEVTSKVECKK